VKESLLFWPIKLKNNTIFILDETLLPQKIKYIKAKNYTECCRAIRQMKTRAVGQIILVFYTFLLAIKQNKNEKDLIPTLKRIAKTINATRPTLPFKILTDMVLGWAKNPLSLEKNILGFLKRLKNSRIKQAKKASKFIKNGDVVLTHCNVSGSLALMGEFCRQQKKRISFFVTETRPYLQGARLTAWELKQSGFNITVIPDSAVAHVVALGLVTKIIVGADQMAKNGDIANKIGTYQIALLARYFKVPFYVLCPPPSKAETGKDITVEIRPDRELLEFQGKRIAPKGVKGFYPAFDITPKKLITKHIILEV